MLTLAKGFSLSAKVHGNLQQRCTRAQVGRGSESKEAMKKGQSVFSSIEAALGELRAGRMIVIVDDEDRENEGDLMMAAELVTPEAINFMATHGRGLVCLAMTSERIDQLKLP